jgi:hypothetical protein
MGMNVTSYSSPATWIEPIETVYQSLPGGVGSSLTPKLPHLSESDALFLGGLVRMPKANRPHGIITWAAEAFRVSRTSIYALGERIGTRLFGEGAVEVEEKATPSRAEVLKPRQVVEVTPERMKRTILRATFPGNASIRPTQEVLREALGESRSVGYISELRLEAGRRAREVLRSLDYSVIKYVQVGRDETFFLGLPVLMVIEPVSETILLAEVCADRQAETWGAALQIVQDQGLTIESLIEDMARNYEASQKLANLTRAEVQKDTWHLMRDSRQLCTALEKSAYQAMQRVLDFEKRLNRAWSDSDFDAYLKAVDVEAKAIEQYDTYASLHGHFCDALEIVDWRAGEIRDLHTANWLLNAVLNEMARCTDSRILRFLKTLRTHQQHLLTFLERLDRDLLKWRNDLWLHLRNREDVFAFERIVAQHWWGQQKLIANHSQWRSFAQDVQLLLENWTDDSSVLAAFASRLMHLFDSAGRTNSVTESINGLLKSFLTSRQSFQSTDSMQAYLDLFVLWHNTRTFERGKRQGKSPFQIAGVHTDSRDWIDLLGY